MARTATKTATIYTRVDPKIKAESEKVLNKLGISMSNAVCMFLHQIVIKQGLPMELNIYDGVPNSLNADKMTKQEFESMISSSLQDIKNNNVYSLDEVREGLKSI